MSWSFCCKEKPFSFFCKATGNPQSNISWPRQKAIKLVYFRGTSLCQYNHHKWLNRKQMQHLGLIRIRKSVCSSSLCTVTPSSYAPKYGCVTPNLKLHCFNYYYWLFIQLEDYSCKKLLSCNNSNSATPTMWQQSASQWRVYFGGVSMLTPDG